MSKNTRTDGRTDGHSQIHRALPLTWVSKTMYLSPRRACVFLWLFQKILKVFYRTPPVNSFRHFKEYNIKYIIKHLIYIVYYILYIFRFASTKEKKYLRINQVKFVEYCLLILFSIALLICLQDLTIYFYKYFYNNFFYPFFWWF